MSRRLGIVVENELTLLVEMDPLGVYVRNLHKKLTVLDQSLSKIETGSLLPALAEPLLTNRCSELCAQDSGCGVLGITGLD